MGVVDDKTVRKVSSAILFLVSRTVWPNGRTWLEIGHNGEILLMPSHEANTVVAFKGAEEHLFWYKNADGTYFASRVSDKIYPINIPVPACGKTIFRNPTFGMCDEEVIMTAKMSGWEEK